MLGAMLESRPGRAGAVHAAAQAVVASLLPSAQAQLADFIAQVVANWDTAQVREVELRVGRTCNMCG